MPASEVDQTKAEPEYTVKQYGTWERFIRTDSGYRYESGDGTQITLTEADMKELEASGSATGLLARDALNMWGNS